MRQQLEREIGIRGPLAAHGVKAEQVGRLAELAAADFTNQTNPRPAGVADYERLFLRAL